MIYGIELDLVVVENQVSISLTIRIGEQTHVAKSH